VVGTAAAVVATGAYYSGAGYYSGDPYHRGPVGGARAAYASADEVAAGSLPHYAVRAYYANGPWHGFAGWDDYAGRNAIKCTPGNMVKLARTD